MKARLLSTCLVVVAILVAGVHPLAAQESPLPEPTGSTPSSVAVAASTDTVELVGQVGGACYAVAVREAYAYYGIGPALTILDVTDPAAPALSGRVLLPGIVTSVAISGTHAYVTAGSAGLFVVDISSATSPAEVGSLDTAGTANWVAVGGDYAYVADGADGLRVVNIADPAAPYEEGAYDTPGEALGVDVSGDYAYVADRNSGLRVIDIAEPAAPVEVGRRTGTAYAVELAGDRACLATGIGVALLDLSEPITPTLSSSFDCGASRVERVGMSGSYAYALDRMNGKLRTIDFSDLAAPRQLGSAAVGDARAVCISGSGIYVASAPYGPMILDGTNPGRPRTLGTYRGPGDARSVQISGGHAFVADSTGLHVLGMDDPSQPEELGGCIVSGGTRGLGLDVANGVAYIADGLDFLRLVDVADPASPREIVAYEPDWYTIPLDVRVQGDRIFFVDFYSKLGVVNVSDPTEPSTEAMLGLASRAEAISVSGDLAYVLSGGGLQILDIAVPAQPRVLSSCPVSSSMAVDVMGGLAAVAGSRLDLVDVSNPLSPTVLGAWDPPALIYDVDIVDHWAYVAAGSAGLYVVDMSNTALPTEVAHFDTPGVAVDPMRDNLGGALDVCVAGGGLIYVADTSGGLLVLRHTASAAAAGEGATSASGLSGDANPDAGALAVDRDVYLLGQFAGATNAVSVQGNRAAIGVGPSLVMLDVTDPAAPSFLGRARLPDVVAGVHLTGTHAYVAAESMGLRIVDVSDPTAPHEVGHCDTPGEARGVSIRGHYAYVADGSAGLRVIDVANPVAPVALGVCSWRVEARGVVVPATGDQAYVVGGGLAIVNIADPSDPWLQGSSAAGVGPTTGVCVVGQYAYVSSYRTWGGGGALDIIDVSNPADPRPPTFPAQPAELGSYVYCVSVSGDYAYVAGDSLYVVDVSNPEIPAQVYDSWLPATAYGIQLAAGHAFLAASDRGLQVYDVGTSPISPASVGAYERQLGGVRDVAVAGGRVYVPSSARGLFVLDVNDASAPTKVGLYPQVGYTVALSDTRAYLATYSGLTILGTASPEPTLLGTLPTAGLANGIALRGPYAYLALGSSGLAIANVSDPAAPSMVASIDGMDYALDVALYGDYALVANGRQGLYIFSVSDPANPQFVSSYSAPCWTYGVAVYDHYAILASEKADLIVVDLADPAHPTFAGNCNTAGVANDVWVVGDRAYVAAGNRGVRVVDLSDPTHPRQIAGRVTPGSPWRLQVSAGTIYAADQAGGLAILRAAPPGPLQKLYLALVLRH